MHLYFNNKLESVSYDILLIPLNNAKSVTVFLEDTHMLMRVSHQN